MRNKTCIWMFLVCMALLPSVGRAAIGFVNGASTSFASGTGATHSITYSPITGNGLIASFMTNSATISSVACVGATCSSITSIAASTGGRNGRTTTYYIANVPSGVTGITVTMGADFNICVIGVVEISGALASSATDGTQRNGNGFGATITANAIATSNASDIIIATGSYFGSISSGPTSSFTNAFTPNTSQSVRMAMAYLIVSSTGSYSTTWTQSSDSWESTTVSIEAAGGSTPSATPGMLTLGVGMAAAYRKPLNRYGEMSWIQVKR